MDPDEWRPRPHLKKAEAAQALDFQRILPILKMLSNALNLPSSKTKQNKPICNWVCSLNYLVNYSFCLYLRTLFWLIFITKQPLWLLHMCKKIHSYNNISDGVFPHRTTVSDLSTEISC